MAKSVLDAIVQVRRTNPLFVGQFGAAAGPGPAAERARIANEIFYKSRANDILFNQAVAQQAISDPKAFIQARAAAMEAAIASVDTKVRDYINELQSKGFPPVYIEEQAKKRHDDLLSDEESKLNKLFPFAELTAGTVVNSYLGTRVGA